MLLAKTGVNEKRLLLLLFLLSSLVQIKHNYQERKRIGEEKKISQIFTDHVGGINLNVEADLTMFSQRKYKTWHFSVVINILPRYLKMSILIL